MNTIQYVARSVFTQIANIAGYIDLKNIAIFFENSHRIGKKVTARLDDFHLLGADGKPIPKILGLINKIECLSAVELTDAIGHTAGRQAMHFLGNKQGQRRDFRNVFMPVKPPLADFIFISQITRNP